MICVNSTNISVHIPHCSIIRQEQNYLVKIIFFSVNYFQFEDKDLLISIRKMGSKIKSQKTGLQEVMWTRFSGTGYIVLDRQITNRHLFRGYEKVHQDGGAAVTAELPLK